MVELNEDTQRYPSMFEPSDNSEISYFIRLSSADPSLTLLALISSLVNHRTFLLFIFSHFL